jgi:uncharacterized protein
MLVMPAGPESTLAADSRKGEAMPRLLMAVGATSTHGPSFFVSDPKALFRRALSAAFRDARAKAAQLAGEAGLALGPVISVREGSFGAPEPQNLTEPGAAPRRKTAAPVRPGTSSVPATVFVVFEAR